MSREIDKDALALHRTNDLIAYYAEHTPIPLTVLQELLPLAIDVLYEARGADGNMASSAAAAAVAVILANYGDPDAPAPDPATWECKIGEFSRKELPAGADASMRDAVASAYVRLTGESPDFLFSGWGARLTAHERAVAEERGEHV